MKSLSSKLTKTLTTIHYRPRCSTAVVSSWLGYCNTLLSGVTNSLVQRLQAVQNAAARLNTGIRRCDHITPVLRQLHWLPVWQRLEFNMASLVYKSLNALSLRYFMDNCQLITTAGCRQLRSSNVATRNVPRSNLPVHLRDSGLHFLSFTDY